MQLHIFFLNNYVFSLHESIISLFWIKVLRSKIYDYVTFDRNISGGQKYHLQSMKEHISVGYAIGWM